MSSHQHRRAGGNDRRHYRRPHVSDPRLRALRLVLQHVESALQLRYVIPDSHDLRIPQSTDLGGHRRLTLLDVAELLSDVFEFLNYQLITLLDDWSPRWHLLRS